VTALFIDTAPPLGAGVRRGGAARAHRVRGRAGDASASSRSRPTRRWRPPGGIGRSWGGQFLLVAARPLREAIASRDPVDMSARAEIEQTLRDLRSGPFISGDLRGE
jgi:hypothetical protein